MKRHRIPWIYTSDGKVLPLTKAVGKTILDTGTYSHCRDAQFKAQKQHKASDLSIDDLAWIESTKNGSGMEIV